MQTFIASSTNLVFSKPREDTGRYVAIISLVGIWTLASSSGSRKLIQVAKMQLTWLADIKKLRANCSPGMPFFCHTSTMQNSVSS